MTENKMYLGVGVMFGQNMTFLGICDLHVSLSFDISQTKWLIDKATNDLGPFRGCIQSLGTPVQSK